MALALCMVFGSVAALPEGTFVTQSTSITATAEGDTIVSGDYEYTVLTDGTIEIKYYSGADAEVEVPSTIDEKTVTSIGEYAFSNPNLTKVTLPSTITNIGINAFRQCEKLESINLPEGLLTIGEYAFHGCEKLETADIPSTVTSIGDGAFCLCTSLKSIVIPEGIKEIGYETFKACVAAETITIPSGVTTIGDGAFSACRSVKTITIPDTVTNIDNWAFAECWALESITIPGSVTTVGDYAFQECKALTSVTFEKGEECATTIGKLSFCKCEKLATVTLSETVKSITEQAFTWCPSITNLTLKEGLEEIGDNAFCDSESLETVTIPKSVTNIGVSVFPSHSDECKLKILCYNDTAGEIFAKREKHDFELLDVEHVEAVAPTCTVDGNIEYWTCGDKYYSDAVADTEITKEDTVDKAKGHSFEDKWTVTKPATCTQTGTEERVCTVCQGKEDGGKETREVKATGHKFPADWTITKQPSVATPGKKTLVCTVCGGKEKDGAKTETIAKLSKDRVYGTNRFETSQKIAQKLKEEKSNAAFQSIIIASGADFADALSASYLAKVKNAPILLVANKATSVLSSTVDYVKKNAVAKATIYIVGGSAVVPDSLANSLKSAGYTIKRIYGKNRYDTNIAVLKEAGVTTEQILIASGADYADALSASAVGKPILLVAGKSAALTPNQKTYLSSLKKANSSALSKAYIIGGTGAVSAGIEKQVKTLFGSTVRVKGNNRYETSVAVAKKFFNNPKTIALAYGLNYPDGLCGGPLAMAYKCPLILTVSQKTDVAAAYAKSVGADSAIAFGGTTLITDKAIKSIIGK